MNVIKIVIILFITELTVLAAHPAGCVFAQEISYHGNVQYATGTYFFQQRTESFSITNGFNVKTRYFSVSFSIPFIYQNSPWISYGAEGMIPTGGPQHNALFDSTGNRPGSGKGGGGSGGSGSGGSGGSGTGGKQARAIQMQSSASGNEVISIPDTSSFNRYSFGDPSLYANIPLYKSPSGTTLLQLHTSIKFPIASPASGFGTGEWDYGLGLSVSQRVDKFFAFANVMKWWFGDMPGLELKDPIAYNLGIGASPGDGKWMINVFFNGYTDIIQGYDPPMTVGGGIGYPVSPKVLLNGLVAFGLSESSADVTFGVGWIVNL